MPATVFPPPVLGRGPFEPMRRRCRGTDRNPRERGGGFVCDAHKHCETWDLLPCRTNVPSVPMAIDGAPNFGNAVFLVGARGDPDELLAYPVCTERAVSSRLLVCVQTLGPTTHANSGIPAGSVPPPLHFEVLGGAAGAVGRLGRFVWTPTSWGDFGPLCVVAGAPVTQWEVHGWAELAPGAAALPYSIQFSLIADRVSGSALVANPITQNNVILDPT